MNGQPVVPVIEAEDLWRRYGGAGKASTIELLAGLARPAKGRVRLFGRHDPVRDRGHVRPRTGVMLQEGGFAGQLTVAETVGMWAGCTTDPLAGMDPEGRHETWRTVRSPRDRGTTIVLTAHHLEEAELLADRLAIMHAGRVVVAGTVTEVRAGSVKITTDNLQGAATRVLARARDEDVVLGAPHARSASLEEVFPEIARHREKAKEIAA